MAAPATAVLRLQGSCITPAALLGSILWLLLPVRQSFQRNMLQHNVGRALILLAAHNPAALPLTARQYAQLTVYSYDGKKS